MSGQVDTEGRALAAGLIRQFGESGPPPETRTDIDTASLIRRFPRLADARVRSIGVEGPHGTVPTRLYEPVAPNGIALVWVHGGAFIAGDLDMPESNWVALELAARGFSVLAVDYRKALNGVHHPVLSDEVAAAWSAAIGDGVWASPPESLHLGGASAGAFLSASVALRTAAEWGRLPDSLLLIYPLVHRTLPEASPAAAAAAETLAPEQRFTPGFVQGLNENYLGSADPTAHPIAFPAEADLQVLPPTLVVNAEADDLRASGEAFAAALGAAGVPHEVTTERGTIHGYLDQPGHAGAVATLDRIAGWLASHAEPTAPTRS